MTNTDRDARHNAVAPKLRRALRVVGWNAVLLMAGLVLIGLAGEAWLRSTVPFMSTHQSTVFVPNVGVLLRPDAEVRRTNRLDFWTVSRANGLGFLDRPPLRSERAAESCHVTMIGDSFVEAWQVPISEKFHVQFEEMAARELPTLDVTTSAFGREGTGQINQLAFYDEYARSLHPRLVVLVFVPNDYIDNFPLWKALRVGLDPEHLPYVSAARAKNGGFRLHPPDPDYQRFKLPRLATLQRRTLIKRALRESWFLLWWRTKRTLLFDGDDVHAPKRVGWVKWLSQRSAYAPLLDEWRPVSRGHVHMRFANEDIPRFFALFAEGNGSSFYKEALAFTAFGLDQFKKRAECDGAALVILASHRMSYFGGGTLARMNEMAAARRISVINQADLIYRQEAELRDAGWVHNDHWGPAGHQWAAEALLEYLKQNQWICE